LDEEAKSFKPGEPDNLNPGNAAETGLVSRFREISYETTIHPVSPKGVYYSEDAVARRLPSLRTKDEAAALTLLQSKNEADRYPREVFRLAIMTAAAIVMTHKHPSGEATPLR